jgi:amino acid adenylation domain-containing protein
MSPDRSQVVDAFNRTNVSFPDQTTVHALFSEQARRRPDAVALVADPISLTYAELEARANRLAHRLLRLGVQPGQPVAILLDRSVQLVVAILACLKSGAAYAPLATEYPVARLNRLLQDSGAPILITAGLVPPGLEAPSLRRLDLNDLSHSEPEPPSTPPPPLAGPLSPAYLMYTSGSTGTPKGVLVPHRAVIRLVVGSSFLPWNSDISFLLLAPPSFDASTLELWGPLLHGGRCVLYQPRHVDPVELRALIYQHQVSCLWLTASLFNHLIDTDPQLLAPLRFLLTGGEALSVPHIRRALALLPSTQLINGYGPTESTTFACTHPIPRDGDPAPSGSIPIGKPIANTRCFVLDSNLQPVPIGVPGELFIGGDGLALGYLNQPEFTAQRFLPDPFSPPRPDGRLYRTGDLCRWRPDGCLEFLGRADEQVKIRGFRIEPGEVVAALEAHPAVQRAVVLARASATDPATFMDLAAFIEPTPGPSALPLPSPAAFREFLRETLPEPFVPSRFVQVEAFPITPNGKLDRNALLALVDSEPTPSSVHSPSPEAPIQTTLTRIWADLLHRPSVSIHDDFFELGGHSLLAMKVVARTVETLGIEFPVRWLFEHRTIAALATRLLEPRPPASSRHQLAASSAVSHPLSREQERLWFLDQTLPDPAVYNVPCAVGLEGSLDLDRLERALHAVARRHHILRSRFVTAEGEPRVEVLLDAFPSLRRTEASSLPGEDPDRQLQHWFDAEISPPFHLGEAPLWRCSCLRLGPRQHVLLLVAHHAICDEWSLPLWLADLSKAYAGEEGLDSRPVDLPPLPLQYADYAVWQQQRLSEPDLDRHRAYWAHHLAGAPPTLHLPLDHPRPASPGVRGGRLPIRCPQAVRHPLEQLATQEGTTPFMLLLAAFHATLFQLTGQDDIVVGAPLAHRHRPELESLIGFFVNTVPVRLRIPGEATFRDLLRSIRHTMLDAFEHGLVPFDEIVQASRARRVEGQTPLFGTVFVWLSQPATSLQLDGVNATPLQPDPGLTKFDLTFFLSEGPEGTWSGHAEFNRDLFEDDSVRRIITAFETLLASIAVQPDAPVGSFHIPSINPEIREARAPAPGRVRFEGCWVDRQRIEAVLESHPQVRRAAVDVINDPSGVQRLVAFFESQPGQSPNLEGLRRQLHPSLACTLSPTDFVNLAQLPLTTEGIPDRSAIAALAGNSPASSQTPRSRPQSALEIRIAAQWTQLLGHTDLRLEDDFFDLGGTSLLAMRLAGRIAQTEGVPFPVPRVFELRTLGAIARSIESTAPTTEDPIQPRPADSPARLSPEQERLWFLHHALPDPAAYNVAAAFCVLGPLDLQRLEQALDAVAQRHELLRCRILAPAGTAQLDHLDLPPTRIPITDLTQAPASPASEGKCRDHWLRDALRMPFDLSRAPLWRCLCLRESADRHLLLLVAHHILCDEWSLPLWFSEIGQAYATPGQPLPPLKVQFADFAAWRRSRLELPQIDRHRLYWRHRLQNPPSLPRLPGSHERPTHPTSAGGRVDFACPPALRGQLESLAAQEDVTPFVLTLAAFQAAMWDLLGTEDLIVGTPLARRERPEVEPLIGFFVNTIPIRTQAFRHGSFRDLIRQVHSRVLEAFEHGVLPFDEMVQAAAIQRRQGENALFQLAFAGPTQTATSLVLEGLKTEPLPLAWEFAKFDLTLFLSECPDGGWHGSVEFRQDLYDAPVLQQHTERWLEFWKALADQPDTRLCDLPMNRASVAAGVPPAVEGGVSPPGIPGSSSVSRSISNRALPMNRASVAAGVSPAVEGGVPPPGIPGSSSVSRPLLNSRLPMPSADRPALPTVPPASSTPLSPTQHALCRIWASLLNRPSVGVQDNFFDLGGHSILVMRLIFEVRQTLGKAIAVTDLFAAPTVAELARIIDQQRPIDDAFKGAGNNPPLFFIPGIPGINYLPPHLTERLGAVSRYHDAFQFPGVDGQQLPAEHVSELADYLIQRLIEVWPQGPIRLAGYSLGGTVALEMARRLDAVGRRPQLLLLLDAAAPDALRPRPLLRAIPALIQYLARMSPGAAWKFLRGRFAGKLHNEREQRIAELGLEGAEANPGTTLQDPVVPTRQRVFDASFRAAAAYHPTPYSGSAVLIRTTDRLAFGLFREMDSTNGWRHLIRGGVQVLDVCGDHWQLFREPAVHELTEHILTCLARLDPPAPIRSAETIRPEVT